MMPVTFDAAENEPINARSIGMADQFAFEMVEADVPIGVLVDDHDVGDRFTPRQLVRVVLVRPDEDDGTLVGRDRISEVVAIVERRRDLQAEHAEQLRDGVGGAAAAEDHSVFVVRRADAASDDLPRFFSQPRGLQAGAGRFGVGVRVQREHHRADVVLDEAERPTGRGVVRVDDRPRTVRAVDDVITADHGLADVRNQFVGIGGGHDSSEPANPG